MRCILDLEANSLINPSKIWVVVCKDIDTNKVRIFRNIHQNDFARRDFLEFAKGVDLWIGHNILEYDLPVLNHIVGLSFNADEVRDTLILSRLVNYSRTAGHSLSSYGEQFGLPKIKFSDWTKWSQEMEEYCVRDVEINHLVYNHYRDIINDVSWDSSIRLEHSFQLLVNDLHNTGFHFNKSKASKLLDKVSKELDELDRKIQGAFPPREVLIREFSPRATKFGTIAKNSVPRSLWDNMVQYEVGRTYRHTRLEDFNPSSHKQLIEVLNEAGWKPEDRTQSHIDTERELGQLNRNRSLSDLDRTNLREQLNQKLGSLRRTGWKVNELNIESLPKYEPLELWKNKACIQVLRKDGNTKENTVEKILRELEPKVSDIILNTLTEKERSAESIIIKIKRFSATNSIGVITEFLLKLLKPLSNNSPDVARFVENENHLWLITIMPQEIIVDCSASFVTDTWDGLRDIQKLQQSILKIQAAKLLAKRILLEARRRSLVEWIGLVKEDSRIHGRFVGLGSWTGRMAHQMPNTANIPTAVQMDGSPKLLGKELRELWSVPKGKLLVGCDAEGIQLRIFAHYIEDEEFTDALVRGSKAEKTDPHSLNQRILGSCCKTRQSAKRFVYALLLGGGINKLTSILETTRSEAEEALNRLLARYTGFAKIRNTVFPSDAKRGYFIGLDGRKVLLPGETISERKHLAMSGYLQNGEAIIIKRAAILAQNVIRKTPSLASWKFVNIVHDELQGEVINKMSLAIRGAQIIADSIKEAGEYYKLKCPLAGSFFNDDIKDYTIGTDWYQTH